MNQTESPPAPVGKTKRLVSKLGCLVAMGVAVMVVFFTLVIPLMPGMRPVHLPARCVSNVKQICLGALIWAHDRETNQLPSDFLHMSNELGRLDVLVCPAEQNRTPARDWASFTTNNCSYEIVGGGTKTGSTNIFIRCQVHGHLGLADASVIRSDKQ